MSSPSVFTTPSDSGSSRSDVLEPTATPMPSQRLNVYGRIQESWGNVIIQASQDHATINDLNNVVEILFRTISHAQNLGHDEGTRLSQEIQGHPHADHSIIQAVARHAQHLLNPQVVQHQQEVVAIQDLRYCGRVKTFWKEASSLTATVCFLSAALVGEAGAASFVLCCNNKKKPIQTGMLSAMIRTALTVVTLVSVALVCACWRRPNNNP